MGTGSLSSLRRRNARIVITAVQTHPRCSRADVARLTGLSTSAVSTLVADLVASGVLVELGTTTRSGGGRPAVPLGLSPGAGTLVGIHLGHADLRVVLTSLDGVLLDEVRHDLDVDHEPRRSLDQVVESTARLLAAPGVDHDRVLGIGVAVSAPVVGSRLLTTPPMLLDWEGVDITGSLRSRTGLAVHLGNDATLGALAEWRLGAGAAVDDLVYVMLSDGVGCGLVLGGRLHTGSTGTAGELGHLRAVQDGTLCRCGSRGCLETVASKRALVASLAHTRGPGCSSEQLLDLAESGDGGALGLLRDAGAAVGEALVGFCTMADPGLVVVGGDLASRRAPGDALVLGLDRALREQTPAVGNRAIRVVRASLGARAEALGGALLAGTRARGRLADSVTAV